MNRVIGVFFLLFLSVYALTQEKVKLTIISQSKGGLYIDGVYKTDMQMGDIQSYELKPDSYIIQIKSKDDFDYRYVRLQEKKEQIVRLGRILEDSITRGSLLDERDGQGYGTVRVGRQWWMSENMRYDLEGSFFSSEYPSELFGRLYNWEQAQVVCPKGWRLPSDEDWKEMEFYLETIKYKVDGLDLGGDVIGQIKSNKYWGAINGFNTTGLNVVPAGFYVEETGFDGIGQKALFWTSTKTDDGLGWSRSIFLFSLSRVKREFSKYLSCRCIKK